MKSISAYIEREQGEWQLTINNEASEQDLLLNHHLEQVGDTIESVTMKVNFCPYCGEKLTTSKELSPPYFKHHNFDQIKF